MFDFNYLGLEMFKSERTEVISPILKPVSSSHKRRADFLFPLLMQPFPVLGLGSFMASTELEQTLTNMALEYEAQVILWLFS